MVEFAVVLIALIVGLTVIVVGLSGIRIIQPYEQGLLIVLGRFRRRLQPGFNFVLPMISQVVKLDLRTQVLDVPRQEVITRDNSPTQVDAVIYIRIIDPDKAYFQVANYRLAVIALAQTTLRSVIGDMELDEILYQRDRINTRLRDILDHATDAWGVRVEAVEIREVDPVGPVKAAMEEQTSAERQRRAAILRADGEKRSKILVAEGDKRSRILQAEGIRQSQVLEAQGERLAKILKAQGEGQALRVLSLGAATLDQKALTVLSLETLKEVGYGQSTKIIIPFELSRMAQGVAKYFGTAMETKEAKTTDVHELEKVIGKSTDVLGEIPTTRELKAEMDAIEKAVKAENTESEAIAHLDKRPPEAHEKPARGAKA